MGILKFNLLKINYLKQEDCVYHKWLLLTREYLKRKKIFQVLESGILSKFSGKGTNNYVREKRGDEEKCEHFLTMFFQLT
jgi:hypothetical protein